LEHDVYLSAMASCERFAARCEQTNG
jgi:hypothetical protein